MRKNQSRVGAMIRLALVALLVVTNTILASPEQAQSDDYFPPAHCTLCNGQNPGDPHYACCFYSGCDPTGYPGQTCCYLDSDCTSGQT